MPLTGSRDEARNLSVTVGRMLHNGAFRADELLQASGGIETWIGTAISTNTRVVIKAVGSGRVPRSIQQRIVHEAEILRTISSSHLVRLLHLGREGSLFYLVTEYAEGLSLEKRLRERPLSIHESLAVARCLLGGLRDVHAHGVIHGDVKPSNAIVNAGAPITRATLIDFGLAHDALLDGVRFERTAGTARYMSPERAGLLGSDVDERSDLYSVGVVLFECVTGRPPFCGSTIGEVLRHHLTSEPPDLRTIDGAVPQALNDIVQRLLRKDPRDRYQSAEGALHDVERVIEAMARGDSNPRVVVGSQDRRRMLTEPTFVGRAMELESLQRHFQQAAAGHGGLVLLEGESGGGKTRALGELGTRCAHGMTRTLRGKGVADVGQRPFQVLVGVAEDIAAIARGEPSFLGEIRQHVVHQEDVLGAAIPELREFFDGAGPSSSPEAFGEVRAITALVSLLASLGHAERPALVLLDDCQWADASTYMLLRYWARYCARANDPVHVLVVAAFRSEEIDSAHALRQIDAPIVELRPLPANETEQLVSSMAGELPKAALEVITRLGEGSPFMAAAILRGLVESGALRSDGDGWSCDRGALEAASSSRRAAAFLARRFSILPPKTLTLLSVGAVLGREFDVDLAMTLSKLSPEDSLTAIDEARRRHLIWMRPHGARAVFFHDKLRETLLRELSTDEHRRLHLEAALRLETSNPSTTYDIAYHFDAAGAPERALPYALRGGDQARAGHALEIAEQQYRIAMRGAKADDRKTRFCIAEGLGDILMLRGRYEPAKEQFLAAEELADGNDALARLAGKLGELAFKQGNVAEASTAIERGLVMMGRIVPRSSVAMAMFCVWEIFVQMLHTLLPRLFLGRLPMTASAQDMRALPLYSRLAYAYWFERGKVACLWTHLRGMNLAERYPPTKELAQSYSEHSPVMTTVVMFARGIRYAERSFAIRTQLGDEWGQGQARSFHGIALYSASRFEECVEKLNEALPLLERTGDRWEVHTAQWHIAYCYYRLGRLREALEIARQVRETGAEIGDAHAEAISLSVWSKASGGNIPQALVEQDLGRVGKGDAHTSAETLQADAIRLLREGSAVRAAIQLERAHQIVEKAGLRQEYVTPILPWMASALRVELETMPLYDPALRKEKLQRALSWSHRAVRAARAYQNNLPHALREHGLLLAMAGRHDAAREALSGSITVAERFQMKHELSCTLLARGRVASVMGWQTADEDLARGTEIQRAIESELTVEVPSRPSIVTLSLVDRFEALLQSGRDLAGALSREAVFQALREAGTNLLRADQATLIEIIPHDDRMEFYSADRVTFSATVVKRALSERRPVTLVDAHAGPSDSIVLSGSRSVLCVPIFRRGTPAACLYVVHSQIGQLFGALEERLAEFIAALGGAALESAESFSREQALSEERARLYGEAQSAVRAREEFLSIASHELRTPLTPLLLQLESLERVIEQRGSPEKRVIDKVRVMNRQTQRLAQLINNLLDVSRISAGRLDLNPESLSAAELVNDVVERFGSEASAAGSSIRVHVAEDTTAQWDRLRIEQVLSNLLSNAIKYGNGGTIDIHVGRLRDHVLISVRDRGVGINPTELPRLFRRFERARNVQNYGGLGLGLYISRQIVDAHGGTIDVGNVSDGGAIFTVDLPLQARKERPSSTASAHGTANA